MIMDVYKQEDLFPEFESESSSGDLEKISDLCCNGCGCKSEIDHLFVLEEIDFDQ